jgi:hypothetical protein
MKGKFERFLSPSLSTLNGMDIFLRLELPKNSKNNHY